jgi:hypothetical protein
MLADTGIPMIGAVIFLGWFMIIPVVVVETLIAMKMLRWRLGYALGRVAGANVPSMLLGFPIAWFVWCFVPLLTGGRGWGDGSILGILQSPAWFGPGYAPHLRWAMPLALITLCVPFFFLS